VSEQNDIVCWKTFSQNFSNICSIFYVFNKEEDYSLPLDYIIALDETHLVFSIHCLIIVFAFIISSSKSDESIQTLLFLEAIIHTIYIQQFIVLCISIFSMILNSESH